MNVKLRKLREEKHISQDTLASILDISQPQYCRKEANLVGFTEDEWNKIAVFLDTSVEKIKNDDAKVVQNNNGTATNFAYIINVSDQLVAELKEHNQSLKEIIEMQKQEIARLKNCKH